ncbi:hypothetical protein ZOSMA_78G00980 [Zostera marina]|uniref:Telomere-associated protein Rif1 N-terminal domain-containing protein n=1 Tax=Zostera marina TaxID=29655 RepID=A0A0K9NQG6_ZOSMR|nr:hypothetical protein ZOSMA_78G00980 [Zostera marina]
MAIPPPLPQTSSASLVFLSPHQAPHPTDRSLYDSYTILQSQSRLQPPFSLSVPNDYADLTRAIVYGILTDSRNLKVHFTHLHSIVVDGYALFTSTLVSVVEDLYPSLRDEARFNILWALSILSDVSAVGLENLVVALLRRINGGDFSANNMWLADELLSFFIAKWDRILEEMNDVLVCGLFVFLRLLADHYRLRGHEKLKLLKKKEVDFCIRLFREHFDLCLGIGRDLIRLLQEVVFIPDFRDVWRDLISDPGIFNVPWFKDLVQIYQTTTPTRFFLLRVNVEIETKLRFMLTNVKWGSQMRYQNWFSKKFLCRPEQDTVIADLIRFVCRLDDKVSGTGVISRWMVIGWLLTSCKKNYFAANAKLSLFYDWLFFDEMVDNVMSIEPAVLLMVHSLPKYSDLTNTLMEFLFLLVDNYDTNNKDMIAHGVSESFKMLVKTRVVSSLSPLISENTVAPVLRKQMNMLLSRSRLIEPYKLMDPVINCLQSGFDFVKKQDNHLKVMTTEEAGVSFNKSKVNYDSSLSSRTKLNKESSQLNSLESLKESSRAIDSGVLKKDQIFFEIADSDTEGVSRKLKALENSVEVHKVGVSFNKSKVNHDSSLSSRTKPNKESSQLNSLESLKESSRAIDSGVLKKDQIFFEIADSDTEGRKSKALENSVEIHEVNLKKSDVLNIELGHESLASSKPEDVIKSSVFSKPKIVVESPMLSKMEATNEISVPSKTIGNHDSPPSSRIKVNKESSMPNCLDFLQESCTSSIRLTVPWNLESSGPFDSRVSKKPRIFFKVAESDTEGVSKPSKALENLVKDHEVGLKLSETVNFELAGESFTLSKPEDVVKSPVFSESEFVMETSMPSEMEVTKASSAPIHLSQKDQIVLAKNVTSDIDVLKNLVEDLGVDKTKNSEFSQESFPFSNSEDANNSLNGIKFDLPKESSLLTNSLEGIKELPIPTTNLSQNISEISADLKIGKHDTVEDIFSSNKLEVRKNSPALSKPGAVKRRRLHLYKSDLVKATPSKDMPESTDNGLSTSNTESATPTHLKVSSSCEISTFEAVKNLIDDLEVTVKHSVKSGLESLQKLLTLFTSLDMHEFVDKVGGNSSILQLLVSQITKAFNSVGHDMFGHKTYKSRMQLKKHSDDEIHSATTVILQTYIFCPHERMRGLLLLWSGNRCPVGACLLYYVCRLAYEARSLRRSRHGKPLDVEKTLLHHHIAGYRTHNREASSIEISIETMDYKFINELVDEAFVAYRTFLVSLVKDQKPQSHEHGEAEMISQDMSGLVFSDIVSANLKKPEDFQSIFSHLSDLSTSRIEFIQMVVDIINPTNIVSMHYGISVKEFALFGNDLHTLCKIVISSLSWKSSKQTKLWSLLCSEIMVNNIKVEEMVFNLCTTCINPVLHSVAMEGLFMLIKVCSPTPEFIHLLTTLPKIFGDFASAVLCCWAFNPCSGSLFATSLNKWLQKVDEKQIVFPFSKKYDLNHFVVYSLLELLDKFIESPSDLNILEIKGKLLYLIKKSKDNNMGKHFSVKCRSQRFKQLR